MLCLQVWEAEHKGVQEELLEEHDEAAVRRGRWRRPHTKLPPNCAFAPVLSTCPQNKLFQSKFIAVISPGASY